MIGIEICTVPNRNTMAILSSSLIRTLLLLSALALSLCSQAQSFTISGNVSEQMTNNPLQNKLVSIEADSINLTYSTFAFTDTAGNYSVVIPNGAPQGVHIDYYIHVEDCIYVLHTQSVSNNQGTTTSGTANFTICGPNSIPCQASFTTTPDSNSTAPGVFFTSTSTGNPTNYLWDFGDGNTSTQQNPFHTYASFGTYNVCLIINGNNCSDTSCSTITVAPTPCVANFWHTTSGLDASFSSTSSGGTTTKTWDMGDGNTMGNVSGFTYTYASPGTYTVCLYISNPSINCADTLCQTVTVSNPNLKGYINTGNSAASEAKVWLINFDPQTNQLSAIDSTLIGPQDSGYYIFPNVAPGNYLVKGALLSNDPNYNGYLPTYYGDQLMWSNATTIAQASSQNNWTFYTVNLVQGVNPGGPGFIGGNVTQGANKQEGPGDPVENALVLLLDLNDNPIAYAYSDVNGEFEFPGLAYGTYQVYTEVLGKPTNPAVVSISAGAPSNNSVGVVINSSGVTTGIFSEENTINHEITLYPNPAIDQLNLALDLTSTQQLIFLVVNSSGQRVKEVSYSVYSGAQTLQLDLREFPRGIYSLVIRNDKGELLDVQKFTKH